MFEATTPADHRRTVRAADTNRRCGFSALRTLEARCAGFTCFPLFCMETKQKPAPAKEPRTVAPTEERRVPIHVFRIDDVSASVFSRAYNDRTFYSVSFSRSYKSASGEWRYTKNFDREDLGKIVALCQQASEHIDRLAGGGQAKTA